MKFFKTINKAIRNYFKLFDFNIRLSELQFPPDGFFTQAEVNQLKVVLAEAIRYEQSLLDSAEFNLNMKESLSEGSYVFYRKQKESCKKRIKLLSNLAYKTKHKIIYTD